MNHAVPSRALFGTRTFDPACRVLIPVSSDCFRKLIVLILPTRLEDEYPSDVPNSPIARWNLHRCLGRYSNSSPRNRSRDGMECHCSSRRNGLGNSVPAPPIVLLNSLAGSHFIFLSRSGEGVATLFRLEDPENRQHRCRKESAGISVTTYSSRSGFCHPCRTSNPRKNRTICVVVWPGNEERCALAMIRLGAFHFAPQAQTSRIQPRDLLWRTNSLAVVRGFPGRPLRDQYLRGSWRPP